jgi:hypothetical protein
VNWSFAGDGTLVTSPIVVNEYVVIGSTSSTLYALDAATGSQLWAQSIGAAIPRPQSGGLATEGQTGLAARDDDVPIVPAGTAITAFVLSTTPYWASPSTWSRCNSLAVMHRTLACRIRARSLLIEAQIPNALTVASPKRPPPSNRFVVAGSRARTTKLAATNDIVACRSRAPWEPEAGARDLAL